MSLLSSKTGKGGIKSTLFILFAVFTVIMSSIGISFFWMEKRFEEIATTGNHLSVVSIGYSEANSQQKDFFLFESTNPVFFESGESQILAMHDSSQKQVLSALQPIREAYSTDQRVVSQLDTLKADFEAWYFTFQQIVTLTKQKGFENWGLIGKMRNYIYKIEESPVPLPLAEVLMIRRYEKDYLLRKQDIYIEQLATAINRLRNSIEALPPSTEKPQLLSDLQDYHRLFLKVVALEEKIGHERSHGLKSSLFKLNTKIEEELREVEANIIRATEDTRQRLRIIMILSLFVFALVLIGSSSFIHKKLGKRLVRLSASIEKVVASDFQAPFEWQTRASDKKDEIAKIGADVGVLYKKVQKYTSQLIQQKEQFEIQAANLKKLNARLEENSERTAMQKVAIEEQNHQITIQKDELEQNYYNLQMLSLIGQQILSKLDKEFIIREVAQHVESMMGEQTFAFGIHFRGEEQLRFMIIGEDGEMQEHPISFSTPHLGIYSFLKMEEILISHADEEYIDYIPKRPDAEKNPIPQSYLYIPLHTKNNKLGVLTVKTPKKNAYSSFQVNIFRNIAAYTSIALENSNIYGKLSAQQEELEAQTQMMSAQTEALQAANQEVEKKNHDIMSSINSARRMQQAILPRQEEIKAYLSDFFVFYQPRNIVSGDFYFFHVNEETGLITIVAADCTGHGVPGALTSMVGNGLLDTIVQRGEHPMPHRILDELNKGVLKIFRQGENENTDGMDISIAVIDKAQQKLYFAGAKNPIVYVQNGELHYIKGDKYPIGGGVRFTQGATYHTHEIDISTPTMCYLFSDGYQDQFGGESGRKMTGKRMRKLLSETAHLPAQKQLMKIEGYFWEWMTLADERQLDDILVMGFRVGGSDGLPLS